MGKKLDISGQKFNKLTALKETNLRKDKKVIWEFICDCGKKKLSTAKDVKSGNTKSCGCLIKEVRKAILKKRTFNAITKKNGKHLPLYTKWQSMKTRCYYPAENKYNQKHYKDKKISVCDEWMDFKNFKKWAECNGYNDSKKLYLDRIDNNKGYSPENCRFVDSVENTRNRTNTVRINGKPLMQIAQENDVCYYKLYAKIKNKKLNLEDSLRELKIKKTIKNLK